MGGRLSARASSASTWASRRRTCTLTPRTTRTRARDEEGRADHVLHHRHAARHPQAGAPGRRVRPDRGDVALEALAATQVGPRAAAGRRLRLRWARAALPAL